ncbi:MAG: lipoyl(octanoyl) transferase LipB [Alistipes sp.]|nr:lipoyl(octanoyl) transferase LipB [Candidatus Alistipes equi]
MEVKFTDLGVCSYERALEIQRREFSSRVDMHFNKCEKETAGHIFFVEHTPVYTLGKNAKEENVLVSAQRLNMLGAELFRTDRGGDVTFHGPGQIVAYPILDLDMLGIGLRRYVEILEQSVMDTLLEYGVESHRENGATGVWMGSGEKSGNPLRKICAIGVKASHFITMHGLAFNVSTNLDWFKLINPCGFTDRGVTSLEREIEQRTDYEEVKSKLLSHLTTLLCVNIQKEK